MKIIRHPLILGAMVVALFTVSAQAQDTGTSGTTEQTDTTTTTTTTGTTGGAPPPSAYEQLSTGGRKIADAMFEGQSVTGDGPEAWSVEQIAAAKQDGQGWGQIFHDLKSQGLTDAKNLGELVSGRYQPTTSTGETTTTGETAAAVTEGGAGKSSGQATKHRRYSSGATRTYGKQGVSGAGHVGSKGRTQKITSDGVRHYGKNVSPGQMRGGNGITTAAGSTHGGNHAAGIKGGNQGTGAVHGNGGGNSGGHGGGKGRH